MERKRNRLRRKRPCRRSTSRGVVAFDRHAYRRAARAAVQRRAGDVFVSGETLDLLQGHRPGREKVGQPVGSLVRSVRSSDPRPDARSSGGRCRLPRRGLRRRLCPRSSRLGGRPRRLRLRNRSAGTPVLSVRFDLASTATRSCSSSGCSPTPSTERTAIVKPTEPTTRARRSRRISLVQVSRVRRCRTGGAAREGPADRSPAEPQPYGESRPTGRDASQGGRCRRARPRATEEIVELLDVFAD